MPSGDIPPNPSELLSSIKMKHILSKLSEDYDYIIIDLPPVSAVSDGLTISNLLSGMIIVVRPNYCDKHSLAYTMRQMEFLKVRILGFVMNSKGNKKRKRSKYGYKYQYKYDYKKEDI